MSDSEDDVQNFLCGYCEGPVEYEYYYEHSCLEKCNEIHIDRDSGLMYPRSDDGEILWVPESINDGGVEEEGQGSQPLQPQQGIRKRKGKAVVTGSAKKDRCTLDTDQVAELISEVETRPSLWKARSALSSRERSAVCKVWAEVAALPVFAGKITGAQAERKFKNLVDYMRTLSKKGPSGSAATVPRTQWPFYHSLQFIRDQWDQNPPTVSNVRHGINPAVRTEQVEEMEQEDELMPQPTMPGPQVHQPVISSEHPAMQQQQQVQQQCPGPLHQVQQQRPGPALHQVQQQRPDPALHQVQRQWHPVQRQNILEQQQNASSAQLADTGPLRGSDQDYIQQQAQGRRRGLPAQYQQSSQPRPGSRRGSRSQANNNPEGITGAITSLADAVRSRPEPQPLPAPPSKDEVDGMLIQVEAYIRRIKNVSLRLEFCKEIGDYAYEKFKDFRGRDTDES